MVIFLMSTALFLSSLRLTRSRSLSCRHTRAISRNLSTMPFYQPFHATSRRCRLSALKINYEKQLEDFPLRHDQAQPTEHNLAVLVMKASKGAVTMSTCLTAFRRTGIVPLCLETMLQRIVGKQPVVTDLPLVSYIRSLPDPAPRQEHQLKRVGISHNALKATFLGMETISMLAPKFQSPKRTRSFVSGGVLMTRPEMKAAVLEAEVQRRQKLEERAAKA
ncbi:uncharacterized protein PITG_23170 [Phytophthora infestans T30-4]|uniref:Secreted RxLR effector peptide protein n=1 Tax=Phytophthora infestans (strain T30-4) TaxID=403677 RepID=D0P1D4_PHYIT|nr:uncharacterized protein PITG_23170 [Phytophthora infestans T30-4]EEY54164.1 conserved hypothetical protein [Phytophthora infestans T30-4]|eukprot:XP_002895897.1 conserved hypothetical protein [Phytophthora infestans T30-4]